MIIEGYLTFPGGQTLHCVSEMARVVSRNFPFPHFTQDVLPRTSLNVPASQLTQLDLSSAAFTVEYLPMGQLTQEGAAVRLYLPGVHDVQSASESWEEAVAVAPSSRRCFPTTQEVQPAWREASEAS